MAEAEEIVPEKSFCVHAMRSIVLPDIPELIMIRNPTARRYLSIGALCFISGLTQSCSILESRRQFESVNQVPTLIGRVAFRDMAQGPIIVFLTAVVDGKRKVVGGRLLRETGPYFFIVSPGDYWIAAFIDENEDFTHDPTEPLGRYGSPTSVSVGYNEEVIGLNLNLSREDFALLDPPVNEEMLRPDFETRIGNARHGEPTTLGRLGRLAEVVSLDDERFTSENGSIGLWEPLTFLTETHWGLFLLEEYDPSKTPVLFVHGAGGHPGEWEYLVERIDRDKFQPMFLFYPSTLRLDMTGEYLNLAMTVFHNDGDFDRLIVVAHSMGGLVSCYFIDQSVKSGGDYIDTFVFEFEGIRRPHHYTLKGIAPLMLIVAMSWMVFWIDPKERGSQLGVAVTVVLTLIAFHISLTGSLPRFIT